MVPEDEGEKIMPEREKMIQALENADVLSGIIKMTVEVRDILVSMLKEQEAVEPEVEGGGSTWWHVCPECHGPVDKGDHFCRHCGQAFK